MSESEELTKPAQATEAATARQQAMSAVVVIVLAAGAVAVFDRWIMPPQAPVYRNLSIWEALLDSRWVIGAVRLVALIIAIYLVLSVVARVQRGQWLSSVGPFRVAETVQGVCTDQARLEQELDRADETIAALRGQLQHVLGLLADVLGTPTLWIMGRRCRMSDKVREAARRAIREGQRVIRDSDQESKRIRETLETSRRVRAEAMPVLRRAGYVR